LARTREPLPRRPARQQAGGSSADGVREQPLLVEDSREHKKIILYSVPGKEGFYRKLGFLRLLTAMAIFQDRETAIKRGHLGES